MLSLDILLVLAAIGAVWRARVWIALVPLCGSAVHLVVQAGLVPEPETTGGWGASAVALGFVLLVASLAVSYLLRERRSSPGGEVPATSSARGSPA